MPPQGLYIYKALSCVDTSPRTASHKLLFNWYLHQIFHLPCPWKARKVSLKPRSNAYSDHELNVITGEMGEDASASKFTPLLCKRITLYHRTPCRSARELVRSRRDAGAFPPAIPETFNKNAMLLQFGHKHMPCLLNTSPSAMSGPTVHYICVLQRESAPHSKWNFSAEQQTSEEATPWSKSPPPAVLNLSPQQTTGGLAAIITGVSISNAYSETAGKVHDQSR